MQKLTSKSKSYYETDEEFDLRLNLSKPKDPVKSKSGKAVSSSIKGDGWTTVSSRTSAPPKASVRTKNIGGGFSSLATYDSDDE